MRFQQIHFFSILIICCDENKLHTKYYDVTLYNFWAKHRSFLNHKYETSKIWRMRLFKQNLYSKVHFFIVDNLFLLIDSLYNLLHF